MPIQCTHIPIRSTIFDFAGTISATPYFWPLGAEFCNIVTEAIFTGEQKTRWATPWCCGKISSLEIADYLAGLSGVSVAHILTALEEGCTQMQLAPHLWRFAQAQRHAGRQAALVTVNMDVFTRLVVPAHGFSKVFDTIVNSADVGTEDKMALCDIALSRMQCSSFETSLLIDDSAEVAAAFRLRGGKAYQFVTDVAFAEWEAQEWHSMA